MTTRRVIVEWDAEIGLWLVMFNDGRIRHFKNATSVVGFVRGQDKRRVQRRGISAATAIEWRNVPDGFVPTERKTEAN